MAFLYPYSCPYRLRSLVFLPTDGYGWLSWKMKAVLCCPISWPGVRTECQGCENHILCLWCWYWKTKTDYGKRVISRNFRNQFPRLLMARSPSLSHTQLISLDRPKKATCSAVLCAEGLSPLSLSNPQEWEREGGETRWNPNRKESYLPNVGNLYPDS